jgi:aspartate/methionine/tyrosine aminotransferase
MTTNTPINYDIVSQKIQESKLTNIATSSIREIKKLVDEIEEATGEKFVRMEMGIPGLPPTQVGVEAEIEALQKGVAAVYPDIFGIAPLKKEIKRFAKLFLNIEVSEEAVFPTVGAMQGAFASFMTINRMHPDREGTLFLDPGFPVQKNQCKALGQDYFSFDVYNYRGEKLRKKLESFLSTGKVSSMLYSNPNNPSWICFTEEELQIIGELATKYNVVVIEDLAYFGMDFRKDYAVAGKAPYQPTVAKYTDNWLLLISSSKVFSYAGQRIGMILMSDHLFNMEADGLLRYFQTNRVGYSMIFGALYTLSAGVTHSTQYALTAMLKAVNDGTINLTEDIKEYGRKAKVMKEIFLSNGFKIVYDKDLDNPIADGFYFTFSYPGMTAEQLLHKLLYYGVSAISLVIAGSEHHEGVRACVSLVQREQFDGLRERLRRFHADHS